MAITKARAQLNGTWYDLTYNSASGMWEAELTAPISSATQPGGTYNITVEATNDAGVTLTKDGGDIESLNLKVVQELPYVAIISPNTEYITDNMAPIVVEVIPGDYGVNMETFIISMNGVPLDWQTEEITGGYRITHTPSAPYPDGRYAIHAEVKDNIEQIGEDNRSLVVDTVPPYLWVTSKSGITDEYHTVVTGFTNDETSPPVTISVEDNGAFMGTAEVNSDGEFSFTLPLVVGDNNISVIATDMAGLSTEKESFLMRLVTDRTKEDEAKLERLRATGWAAMNATDRAWYTDTVCRGAYNAEDMNRVNRAMDYLVGRVIARGYNPSYHSQGITWTMRDIPNPGQTAAYLGNVESFKALLPDLPPVPDNMDDFIPEEANNIEKILVMVEDLTDKLSTTAWFAGELMAGME